LRVLTAQPGEIPPEVAAPPHLPPRPAPATERESLIEELIAALRTLPVMANAGARAQFVTMTTEQLGRPANIPGDLPIDDFLPALVGTLDRMPGGLAALADVVRALHRDQSVEREIRRTVERLATLG
jgi:hypothetical protein